MNVHETIGLPDRPKHPLMTALGRGLPITLLVDLIDPSGPRSHELFEREGTSMNSMDADVLVIPEAAHAQTA
jgi:hypothetical protein